MEDISSRDEEVSSSDEACSEAPSARCWLDAETCEEAEATCSAPSFRPATIRLMGRVMPRVRKKAISPPKIRARTPIPIMKEACLCVIAARLIHRFPRQFLLVNDHVVDLLEQLFAAAAPLPR